MPADDAFQSAVQHFQANRLAEAEACCRAVLQHDPGHAGATHILGLIALCVRQPKAAIDLLTRAATLEPRSAALFDLAKGLYHLQEPSAGEYCAKFLQSHPAHADAVVLMGGICVARGDIEGAINCFTQHVALVPNESRAHANLATALERAGRASEGLPYAEQAVALDANSKLAHLNLGAVLAALGRLTAAAAHYRRALEIDPNYAIAYSNLASVLVQLSDVEQASACAARAVELDPSHPDAWINVAAAAIERWHPDEAVIAYGRAIDLLGANAASTSLTQRISALKIQRAVAISPFSEATRQIEEVRMRVQKDLTDLQSQGVCQDLTHTLPPILFNLAYHGMNDRDIHQSFGRLFSAPQPPLKQNRAGDAIRVGLISRFFRDHTIGRLFAGIPKRLPRPDFHVTTFTLGEANDEVAAGYAEDSDAHITLPLSAAEARSEIQAHALDVLIYTDIGMDPMVYALACSRLAAIQCVLWGHPVTTGIATMDYFLSSESLDPPANAVHYSEKLVRLAGLPVVYPRPSITTGRSRTDLGLPDNATLYVCPQTLFKFHPDFDPIVGEILRRDPRGRLILIEGFHPRCNELLLGRFNRTMPDVVDRIQFLRRLSRQDFLALNAMADVLLDPIHFGGGNTTYEALAVGTPVVTLPGKFLRGRITHALFEAMDYRETVTHSPADYIAVASRLGTDPAYRTQVRDEILARCDVLYNNASGIRALEDFLRGAVAAVRA